MTCLFNDGVTVVLYNTMKTLANSSTVGIYQIMMALLSFFTVVLGNFNSCDACCLVLITECVLGGALIGLLNGLLASLITRFTKHVRVVEPLIIFSTSYFAFLLAECVTEDLIKDDLIFQF